MKLGLNLFVLLLLLNCSASAQVQPARYFFTDKFKENRDIRREASLSIPFSNEAAESELEVDATNETEPRHCGNNPGRSVWMTWQPPAEGVVEIEVVSETPGFSPVVGLYSGKEFKDLKAALSVCSFVRSGEKGAKVQATVFSTDTYQIAVAGEDRQGGTFTLTLTLVSSPKILRQPANVDANVGESVEFAVVATGFGANVLASGGTGTPPPLRYQWKHAGTNLINGLVASGNPALDGTRTDGVTTDKLTLNNVREGWEGNYSVVVSNQFGETPSLPARLSLALAPKILRGPSSQTVNAGASAGMSVSAIGKEPMQYQWQFKGGTDTDFRDLVPTARITGVSLANLSLTAVTSAEEGSYRVIVSNSAGSATSSEAALVVINPDLEILEQPTGQTRAVGEPASFRVRARSRNRSDSELQYQWRFNGVNLNNGPHPADPTVVVSGSASSGSSTSDLTLNRVTQAVAGNYSALVTVRNTTVSKASLSATLTVLVVPPNDHFANSTPISVPPALPLEAYNIGATAEAGEFNHAGESPQNSVWWNWKINDACSLTTLRLVEGAFAGRLAVYTGSAVNSLTPARHQRQAPDRLTFFSAAGTTYSIVADGRNNAVGSFKLNVAHTTTVPLPQITKNCEDQIVLACDPCYLTVEVESIAPLSYKWQKVELDAVSGQVRVLVPDLDPPGQRTTVTPLFPPNSTPERLRFKLSDGAREPEEGLYRILIDNCAGQTNSRIARVSLRYPPEIRQQPSDVLNVRECSPVSFSVVAAGCPPLTYQWRRDGVDLPGRTSVPLSFSSIKTNDMGGYSVVVRNEYGAVTSRLARLTVDPLPRISRQPEGADRRDCTNYTFSVTADDLCQRPLSYQWQKAGINLVRRGTIATERELSLVNLHPNDTGDYRVIVSNVAGSVTSSVARLTVHAGPWIRRDIDQPADVGKIRQGDSFTLKVLAESCSPLSYQWFFSESLNPPLLNQWYSYTDRNLSLFQRLNPASSVNVSKIFVEATSVPVSSLVGGGSVVLTNYSVKTNGVIVRSFGALSGAIESSLTFSNITPQHSGYYLVTMTNDYSWTNSVLTRVTVYPPPPNDHYTNRITLPGTNTSVSGYNIFATRETNEPVHSSSQSSARSIWYSWTAPRDPGFLTVDSQSSSIRTILALYTNSPADARLMKMAEAANTSSSTRSRLLRIGLTDATQVQLAVDGINSEEGNVNLKINWIAKTNCPVILKQPQDLAANKGATVRFSADIEETPFVEYQWYFAPSARTGDSRTVPSNLILNPLRGASGQLYAANESTPSPTLTLTNITEANEGYYVVTLSNKYCSIRSEAARLTLGGILRGMVTDATTGRPIPDAEICGGDPTDPGANYYCTRTDVNGNYELFGVKPGSMRPDFFADRLVVGLNQAVNFTDQSTFKEIELSGKKSGFYNYVNRQVVLLEGGIIRQEFAMSPVLTKGMRFVLNWSDRPADLDVQLATPFLLPDGRNKEVINWQNRGQANASPWATLDFDVRSGRGPESITIHEFRSGTYRLFVNKARAADTGSLTSSEAVVNIYTNSPATQVDTTALYSIPSPKSGEDLFWYVCDIDGDTKTITIRRVYSRTSPSLLTNVAAGSVNVPGGPTEPIFTPPPPNNAVPGYVDYSWLFDKEGSSAERNPRTLFSAPGFKSITLTLTNDVLNPPLIRQLVRTNYVLVTNDPPRVEIVSPLQEQRFLIGAVVPIVATAKDSDSSMTAFQVSLDNQSLMGVNSPASQSVTLFTNWLALKIGTYTIDAGARDVFGESGTARPRIFRITNDPPVIRLTSPASNQLFRIGGMVPIIAVASDSDTPLAKIEFFEGTPPRLILATNAPPDTQNWSATLSWNSRTEGDFTFGSTATDIYGATGSSQPVTIRVCELTGDILIVHNSPQDLEIDHMVAYISQIRYPDPVEGRRDLVTQVIVHENASYDILSTFKLIIWADLAGKGVLNQNAPLFQRAHGAGIPFYFIGERLASTTASLASTNQAIWTDLLQIKPGAGQSSGQICLSNVAHKVFEANWPEAGTCFAPPTPPEMAVTTGARSQVMGRAGDADVLVFYPTQFGSDLGGPRRVTQNFRVAPVEDSGSWAQREQVFTYAIGWLLRFGCSSADLILSPVLPAEAIATGQTSVIARTGTLLTNTFLLTRGGECPPEAVIVTNWLPANVWFESAEIRTPSSTQGRWYRQANAVIFDLGRVEQTPIEMEVVMTPLAPGTFTNQVCAGHNAYEFKREDNCAVLVAIVEGTAPLCRAPPLRILPAANGQYQLIFPAEASCTYIVESSVDFGQWQTYASLQRTENPTLTIDIPAAKATRFYRIRVR